MLGQPLRQRHKPLRIGTKGLAPRQKGDVGTRLELIHQLFSPFRRLDQHPATQLGLFIAQDNPAGGILRAAQGFLQPGLARADNQHIGMRKAVGVAVRIRHSRCLAQPGGPTDRRFEQPRPELAPCSARGPMKVL